MKKIALAAAALAAVTALALTGCSGSGRTTDPSASGDAGASGGFAADATIDGVLSPNDTLARAIITSVKQAGKDIATFTVTGQDSEVESVKSIMAGEQYSTINKDTTLLVQQTIKMIGQLQKGEEVDVNDTEQYDNGVKVVPAYLLPPVIVTKENAAEAYANNPTLLDIVKAAQ